MALRIAFLGLGVMGYHMAGHLKRAGHDLVVYNRTAEKAEKWVEEFGGERASSPAEASANADVVLSCVGRDSDLREITLGRHGAFVTIKRGGVFIDHTTASADIARGLAEAALQRGFHFVDAPVSGGEAGARDGKLTVMCGGGAVDYGKAEPIISTYARQCSLMGPSGAGQLTKMVNQICIAGLVQGLSEGLSFAKASGLDPKAVVEVISKGAAQSWQMDNRSETMIAGKFDYGFAVEWMRKDLGIVLAEASHNGTSLPVTALVDQFYAEVEGMGGKRWDTSSLIARLEKNRIAVK